MRTSTFTLTTDDGDMEVYEAGVEWRQDLPDVCTPIRRGRPTSSYDLIEA